MPPNIASDKSVNLWKEKLATEKSRQNKLPVFEKWFVWAYRKLHVKSPSELVEHQRQVTNTPEEYKVLDLLSYYVNKEIEGTLRSKQTIISDVKSFFRVNRVPLPKEPIVISNFKPPVKIELTPQTLHKIFTSEFLNTKTKAIFYMMYFAFLSRAEFNYANINCWYQIKTQLETGVNPIRIEFPRGREKMRRLGGKPYYTMCGGAAIPAFKEYVESEKIPSDGPIFRSQKPKKLEDNKLKYGQPISLRHLDTMWLNTVVKCGLVKPSNDRVQYGYKLHGLRRIARTLFLISPASNVAAEWFMGHDITQILDDHSYLDMFSLEEWAKTQYRMAEPHLMTVITGDWELLKGRVNV